MAELRNAACYSQALWDVANEMSLEDEILKDAKLMVSVFSSEKELLNVLRTPAVSKNEKKQILRNIFEGHTAKELLNLLYILIDKNSFSLFPHIVSDFETIKEREKGIVSGEVVSVEPLSSEHLRRLEEETAGLLCVKKVKLTNTTDKSIIGGVKIFADGKLVDASVRHKLDSLAEDIF